MKKLINDKFYKNFLFYLIGFYCFMVFLGKRFSSHSEIFPFFHWGLYVSTPQTIEKDFIDIYAHKNSNNKIDFYEYTEKNIGRVTARNNLYLLKTCEDKPCFEDVKNRVLSLLPKNSYAVFYSINELDKVDTIGLFINSTYKVHKNK